LCFLASSTSWNQFMLITYIIKTKRANPLNLDLPLFKNDVTTISRIWYLRELFSGFRSSLPANQKQRCPLCSKTSAHLLASNETPSIPAKRVETNPMFSTFIWITSNDSLQGYFLVNCKIWNPTVIRHDYYPNIKNKSDSKPARFIVIHKFLI